MQIESNLQSASDFQKEEQGGTDLAILGKVNLESLGIVLKTERGHREQNILAIDSLALLLLALLRSCSSNQSVIQFL